MKVHIPGYNATVIFPDNTPHEEVKRVIGEKFQQRPTHDDLAGAAVTGADSLALQAKDPAVKPAVKMTLPELVKLAMERKVEGKTLLVLGDGTSYVMDPQAGNIAEIANMILSGKESAALGYPDRTGLSPGETIDTAVTKQGEVVTDLGDMRQHAEAGNVAWAAEGRPDDALQHAEKVAAAIRRR